MSEQKRETNLQAKKNAQQKRNLELIIEQNEELANPEKLSNNFVDSISSAGDDSVHTHTGLLANNQIPVIQRQNMATQIGQVAGNYYLQRVLSQRQNHLDEQANEGNRNTASISNTRIEQQQIPYQNITALSKSDGLIMRGNGRHSDNPRNRSRGARPKDAPRGTKPIDQTGLDHDQIHDIKDGIGARPADWVGISPEGHVISNDPEGNAEDHGHWEDYTNSKYEIPDWIWEALVGVALAAGTLAVIACFASGACEIGALIGALGYSAALIIISLFGGSEDSEESTTNVKGTYIDYDPTISKDTAYA